MSSAASSDKPAREAPKRQTFLTKTVGNAFLLLGWLIFALLINIAQEWIGLTFIWTDQGSDHAKDTLLTELNYLNNDFKQSLVTHFLDVTPSQYATGAAVTSHEYLYEKSGIKTWVESRHADIRQDQLPVAMHYCMDWSFMQIRQSPRIIGTIYKSCADIALLYVGEYVKAAVLTTAIFIVRLSILTLASPVFFFFGMLGLTKGLASRDIRRWSGGRETSTIYHHAKRFIGPSFIACWIIYLSLPISIHPNAIILPFALMFGFSIAVTSAMYKKYL